jgi:hypothetical protein
MPVTARHDQVRVLLPGQPYQTTRVRLFGVDANIALTDGTMVFEILRYVADTRPCGVLLIRRAQLDDRDS